MENKQTAVEWIIEQVYNSDWKNMSGEDKLKLFKQAKEMEREQRFEDFKQGFHSAFESLEAANNSVQSKTFKSE